MRVGNPKTEQYHDYWDDGNKNEYPWFKKGLWKRQGRKKFIKNQLRDFDKE